MGIHCALVDVGAIRVTTTAAPSRIAGAGEGSYAVGADTICVAVVQCQIALVNITARVSATCEASIADAGGRSGRIETFGVSITAHGGGNECQRT